jgi:hypothetical protein
MRSDASWSMPRPDLRASDAERERVAAFLRDQAAEGRLTPDELDERVGAAYQAVTVRQLERLVWDLPGAPLGAPRPAAPSPRRAPDLRPLALIGLLLFVAAPSVAGIVWIVLFAGVMAVLAVLTALALALGPFLLLAAAAYAFLRRRDLPHRPFGRITR